MKMVPVPEVLNETRWIIERRDDLSGDYFEFHLCAYAEQTTRPTITKSKQKVGGGGDEESFSRFGL